MDFDFTKILLIAVVVTGLLWVVDKLFLRKNVILKDSHLSMLSGEPRSFLFF